MAFASIIIPTHNRPQLLGRAIKSSLAQVEPRGVEVVVVDDGSNPPAKVPKDPRIRLIRLEKNRGGAAALGPPAAAERDAIAAIAPAPASILPVNLDHPP